MSYLIYLKPKVLDRLIEVLSEKQLNNLEVNLQILEKTLKKVTLKEKKVNRMLLKAYLDKNGINAILKSTEQKALLNLIGKSFEELSQEELTILNKINISNSISFDKLNDFMLKDKYDVIVTKDDGTVETLTHTEKVLLSYLKTTYHSNPIFSETQNLLKKIDMVNMQRKNINFANLDIENITNKKGIGNLLAFFEESKISNMSPDEFYEEVKKFRTEIQNRSNYRYIQIIKDFIKEYDPDLLSRLREMGFETNPDNLIIEEGKQSNIRAKAILYYFAYIIFLETIKARLEIEESLGIKDATLIERWKIHRDISESLYTPDLFFLKDIEKSCELECNMRATEDKNKPADMTNSILFSQIEENYENRYLENKNIKFIVEDLFNLQKRRGDF